jgi:hypothetical protein
MGAHLNGRSTDHRENESMSRTIDAVSLHAACRRLKVRSDYLRGVLDGLGIEPVKAGQLLVLNPEQFQQVRAQVEKGRAVEAK